MNTATFEDALQAWMATAIQLQVIWSNQPLPEQGKPYATLKLVGPSPLGQGDGVTEETDLTAPRGEEITQTFTEHQEWTLSVQVFADPAAGATTARALLGAGRMRAQLPSAIETLAAAGVVVVAVGDTQDLSAVFGTRFEARAAMDVRLRTVDQVAEKTTYIERVGIWSELTGGFQAPEPTGPLE